MAGTYVDDLIAHAARYDPRFVASLRGAEPGQVAELERAIGQPLPDAYTRYLARMGGSGFGMGFDFCPPFSPASGVEDVLHHRLD